MFWMLLLGNQLPSRIVFVWCVGGGGLMWDGEQNNRIPWGDFSKYTYLWPFWRKFDKISGWAVAGMCILNWLLWGSDAPSGWENWFGTSCYILPKWNESTIRTPRKSSKKEVKWKERKMFLGSVCPVETFITINTFFFFVFSWPWLIFLHAKCLAATSVFFFF